ncbi:conserved exported hypothetical protein [Candidatus Desulfarcum epimagneticum]|uniref:Tetrahaem cytochrome domain-containing protein n=1 Tax=uncultured Desulfobacteraceae bacterium TaxID=218296 RepID=A0A484HC62_9BACT|nr:conserved exported hypothetical protein [uncultured Desulfobacteraceae bacterium]
MKKELCFVLSIAALVTMTLGRPALAGPKKDFFSSSLHHTAEGMRRWYEAEDGFMALTGIPYDQLACKKCHAENCDVCHLEKTKTGAGYSLEMARKNETCYKCHTREMAAAKMDQKAGETDAHAQAGMTCADCHTPREIHGDGHFYTTMRDPAAKDAACVNCHARDSEDYPAIPDVPSHTVHKGRLDCNACHVRNTMTCYNCHFGEFARTGSKPKSFVGKIKDFLLLVKYKGKITSGNLQTLVSAQNKPFIVYAPYLTHSIMSQGRKCDDCHGTKAVETIASGKTHDMAEFRDGKPIFYKGVVPLEPNRLNWPFFKKTDGKWTPFEPDQKPLVQMGLFVEPLSQDELDRLNTKRTGEPLKGPKD